MSGAEIAFALASVVGGVASTTVSVRSAQRQQAAAQANARFQQELGERNADIATQAAAEEESRFRLNRRRRIASAAAQIGASGAVIGEGTPLELLGSLAATAELDALSIRHRGTLSAQNALLSGGFRSAQSQQQAGQFGDLANASLLGGASGVGETIFGGIIDLQNQQPPVPGG